MTRPQTQKIAQAKMEDMNARDLDAAAEMVLGTARSMGRHCEE